MPNKITLDWLKAAFIRSLKTMAQTALSMFTVGQTVTEISWLQIVSISAVAGLYSMLTSIVTGLPETTTHGTLQIDTSDPAKDTYQLSLDSELETLGTQKKVTLTVNPNADLSQK